MKIALLAWGSLLWKPGCIKITGEWSGAGPLIPLEFSRVSENKKLTLVIDGKDGAKSPALFATSAFSDLAVAVANLMEREQAERKNIGVLQADIDKTGILPALTAWWERSGYDAAIWTASPPNFAEALGHPFSIDTATKYIADLDRQTQTAAIDYFKKTPPQIRTPLRSEIEKIYP